MRIYLAAPLAAADLVRSTRDRLVSAGHELPLDWTEDRSVVERFASYPEKSAAMASAMIDAVLAADAVLVLATGHEGRGMFVELGAALARAQAGSPASIAVIGEITRESVFFLHPRVARFATLDDWLATGRTTQT
ncbi:hypothetical protein [Luteipulveratus flavus]|uniref:Nucleoside 2-deoxyribosyltransferase n=1 Tax=Luteipulveratus flavus TaxID=3031728 RepID=A0ABT6C1N0_9MICO|nr:hypothetical protein [Luteipulveratus sp. YIM 133296]MDF8262640.1 hypothetical protein [Luteipulveratus sp. YIM 133296]